MSTNKRNSSRNPRIHIISRDNGWAIKKEGLSKASSIHKNKENAISNARKIKKQNQDIVIHKRDGSIQKWEKGKK